MHSEAVNLRLESCSPGGHGSYLCHFAHDYPRSLHLKGHGAADMQVAPAMRYGWYMSALLECG